MKASNRNETIVLGGGCFWCTEAVFGLVDGVVGVTPGYAGGTTENPRYEDVCRGDTGHAEVVSVEFDPGRVSLEDLLDVFFYTHDPTSPDRQGNDVGTQYCSIILYTTGDQKERIEKVLERMRGEFDRPIVTRVKSLERFYTAEDHHVRFFENNPHHQYCRYVVAPKVKKAKKKLGLD